MAITTQIRTAQLTGSYGTATGLINDQGAAVATGSAAAVDLGAVLSQMASAVKRINGASSYSEALAGVFSHTTSTFTGDIRLNGNDIQNSEGTTTLSLDNDEMLTVAGDVTVSGGKITLTNGSTVDSESAGILLLTEDVVKTSAALRVGSNVIQASDGGSTITMDTSDNVTVAGKVLVQGDTAASDAAAVGYTAAEGIIITGQGSTNDVTIKNDLDVAVIQLPTGGTDVTFAGDITVGGGKVTLTNGAIIDSETAGKIKLTEDVVECSADLLVLGNDIDFAAANANIGATVGANILALGAATSTVAALNDLRVDGDILADANENKAIFAAVTSANITLGNGGAVVIPGNLTVQGTTTTVDTTNLLVKDPIIAMGVGAQVANSNGGIAIMSGSNNGKDLVMGRIANDTMAVGILDTQSGSVTSVAGMAVTNFRASALEVAGNTNFIDIATTNLRLVAAVDIVLDPAGGDVLADGNVSPLASNGGALGAAGAQWSDLFLAEGGVINWDNGDMTMTQTSNVLTVASGDINMDGTQKVTFGGSSNWIQLDSNLKVVAAADLHLDAGGNDILLNSVGTNPYLDFNRAGAGESYLNFSTNDGAAITNGSAGFGFKNNAGTMQFKNSGGAWANFGSSTNSTAAKVTKELASPIAAGNRIFGAGNGLDVSDFSGGEDNGRIDLFVNGQLMLSGGTVAVQTKDYALDVASGRADVDIQLNFPLVPDDVVTLAVK